VINYKTAIFRQIDEEVQHTHQDALEFPTGQIVLLTLLEEGQQATVLQLPTTAGVKVLREKEAAFWERVSGSCLRARLFYSDGTPRGAARGEARASARLKE
jgi:hypothetical protein